ncbi:hypothetical protein SK128_008415, partial [Halocaridina rubra]
VVLQLESYEFYKGNLQDLIKNTAGSGLRTIVLKDSEVLEAIPRDLKKALECE